MSTATVNIPYDNTSYLLIDNFNRTDADLDGATPTYAASGNTWNVSSLATGVNVYLTSPTYLARGAAATEVNAIADIDLGDIATKASSSFIIAEASTKYEFLFRLVGNYDYNAAEASFLSIGVRENGGNLQARAAMRTLGDTLSSITMDGGTDSWNDIGTVTVGATTEANIYVEDNKSTGICTLKILDKVGTWAITSPVCTWSSVPSTHSTNTYFGILISKGEATPNSISNLKVW